MSNLSLRIAAGALCALVLFPQAAEAACVLPPRPPEMPQGASASAEEMQAGHEALQKYVNILQTYQACMEQQVKDATPDTKPEDKAHWQHEADVAIDYAHQIADVYSAQLRAFKARQ